MWVYGVVYQTIMLIKLFALERRMVDVVVAEVVDILFTRT